jgi:hypothetical protein
MEAVLIPCSKCKNPLSSELFAVSNTAVCPSCRIPLTSYLFPALYHSGTLALKPESLLTDTESSCFFHPAKKAVVACGGCGRFLCGLCDLEWEGGHLCSSCLEAGKKKGKMKSLENHRVLYDGIALAVAGLPILIWPFTCVTAPIAFYMVLRYWNAPLSIASRSKVRFILAFLLSLGQIIGWIWLIAILFHEAGK